MSGFMAPTPIPTAEQLAYRKVCLYLQMCLGSMLIKVVEAPSRHRNRPEPSLHRLSRTLARRKSRMGPRILQKCKGTLSSIKFNIIEILPQNAHTNNYIELQRPVSHPQPARCFILSHRRNKSSIIIPSRRRKEIRALLSPRRDQARQSHARRIK
jgi:hypothetical protein